MNWMSATGKTCTIAACAFPLRAPSITIAVTAVMPTSTIAPVIMSEMAGHPPIAAAGTSGGCIGGGAGGDGGNGGADGGGGDGGGGDGGGGADGGGGDGASLTTCTVTLFTGSMMGAPSIIPPSAELSSVIGMVARACAAAATLLAGPGAESVTTTVWITLPA